jgi:hypothetical protein
LHPQAKIDKCKDSLAHSQPAKSKLRWKVTCPKV